MMTKVVKEKNKGGRPTKYKKEYNVQANKLCRKGFTDAEMADFFEVNVDTIHEWKKVHKSFSDALKDGKGYSDDKVVDALYNRALGYEFKETKEESGSDGSKTTVTTKQMAADTTAQIFWLKNRRPKEWRNNPEADQGDSTPNITINLVDAKKPDEG